SAATAALNHPATCAFDASFFFAPHPISPGTRAITSTTPAIRRTSSKVAAADTIRPARLGFCGLRVTVEHQPGERDQPLLAVGLGNERGRGRDVETEHAPPYPQPPHQRAVVRLVTHTIDVADAARCGQLPGLEARDRDLTLDV